jgi:hypothetical protein
MTIVWILQRAGLLAVCMFGPTGATCTDAVEGQKLYPAPFEVERVESWYRHESDGVQWAVCWEGHQRIRRGYAVTRSGDTMRRCD